MARIRKYKLVDITQHFVYDHHRWYYISMNNNALTTHHNNRRKKRKAFPSHSICEIIISAQFILHHHRNNNEMSGHGMWSSPPLALFLWAATMVVRFHSPTFHRDCGQLVDRIFQHRLLSFSPKMRFAESQRKAKQHFHFFDSFHIIIIMFISLVLLHMTVNVGHTHIRPKCKYG